MSKLVEQSPKVKLTADGELEQEIPASVPTSEVINILAKVPFSENEALSRAYDQLINNSLKLQKLHQVDRQIQAYRLRQFLGILSIANATKNIANAEGLTGEDATLIWLLALFVLGVLPLVISFAISSGVAASTVVG